MQPICKCKNKARSIYQERRKMNLFTSQNINLFYGRPLYIPGRIRPSSSRHFCLGSSTIVVPKDHSQLNSDLDKFLIFPTTG